MKVTVALRPVCVLLRPLALVATALLAIASASAQDVIYSPFSFNIEGNMPYTKIVMTSITAPSNLAGPAAVGFRVVPTSWPVGTSADAASYVTFSPNALNFTGPNTSQSVSATFAFPKLNLTPGTVLTFTYQVYTTGWGVPVADDGFSINATVTVPQPQSNVPPTVTITSPANNAVFTYNATDLPTMIPMQFAADTISPSSIISIDATLNGNALTLSSVTGLGTVHATGTASMPIPAPGVYKIVANGANSSGLATTSSSFTVVVNGPPPTVVINTPAPNAVYDYVYGAVPLNIPFSVTGNAPVSTTIRTLEATLDGTLVPLTIVGMNTIQATGVTNFALGPGSNGPGVHTLAVKTTNEYGSATASQTFTINTQKAPLTVKADDQTRAYGTANPTLTYTLSGFVNGDTLATSGITGQPALSTTDATSPVGNYPITVANGTLASSHYRFVLVDGNLAVTPAVLTVTAQPATKIYGAALPAFSAAITGFVNNDSASVVSGAPAFSTIATVGSIPATYPIAPALGSLVAANYTFNFVNGPLIVTKALLRFTAGDASRVYGAANPILSAYTVTASDFVNGDTAATAYSGAPSLATVATATSSVAGSPYPISISIGTLASAKYDFQFIPGNLAITKALLTVRADDVTKSQGTANPPLTYSITGFLNNENTASAGISGGAVFTTDAGVTSPVGDYLITLSQTTLSAPNYTFTYLPGNLKILSTVTIGGIVFFDANTNSLRAADEPGIAGIKVQLYKNNVLSKATTTSSSGAYSFTVEPGTYAVDLVDRDGLTLTTAAPITVSVLATNRTDIDLGLGLDLQAMRSMTAGGFTIGYWKNNLSKAVAYKSTGTQETFQSLWSDTDAIRGYALDLFSDLVTTATTSPGTVQSTSGMNQAITIMGSNSSDPLALLKKQLLASEYNLANGAFINGDALLTTLFIYWGEYVASHSSSYSATYLIWAKDWFDAYNNSHGGVIAGPAPVGSSSITSNFNGTSIAAGNYLWFNSVVNVGGRGGKAAVIEANRTTIQITVSGYQTTIDIPAAVITFSSTATLATTIYDETTDTWRTTVPVGFTGDVFLSGAGFKLPVSLPGNLNPVSWSTRFASATTGLTAQWSWAAAVYKQFNDVDPDLLGVKAIDGGQLNSYANSDNGGTPEFFKSYVTAGARGDGKSYTGSYTSTATVAVGQP